MHSLFIVLAQDLFERMRKIREISTDPNYWLNYATFLMITLDQADSAHALLQRATQALPIHEHAHVISPFGALSSRVRMAM
jgi:rRNA biogenesis protein RRP5